MCDTTEEQEITSFLKRKDVHVYAEMWWNDGLRNPGMGWEVVCIEELTLSLGRE